MVLKAGLFIKKEICANRKEIGAVFLMLFLTQIFFFYLGLSQQKTVTLSIGAILKRESVVANPYLVAQQIENLETIGLIKCTKLSLLDSRTIFLDTSYKGSCNYNLLFLNGSAFETDITSSTGQIWQIQGYDVYPFEIQILLWTLRLLTCFFGFYIVRYHRLKLLSISQFRDIEVSKSAALALLAQQVAHDIRSPISALNMVVHGLTEIPEERRFLIRNAVQRINDIVNGLLQKGKLSQFKDSGAQSIDAEISLKQDSILLSPVVDSIISEKRTQFRDRININIRADLSDSFGAFVGIDIAELSRVISNLVNNSVEAIEDRAGEVIVSIREYNEFALIVVKDNGVGIPEHILVKLGDVGVTYGKENLEHSGSGLGIYHAKKTINDLGGSFEIQTREGIGTMIEMKLPIVSRPDWFCSSIELAKNLIIVTVDDDLSIHQIWKQRIDQIKEENAGLNIQLRSFTSVNEFLKMEVEAAMIFFVDFEFLNREENGLDLIQKKSIASKSVMVTGRHDDQEIQIACEDLKIKILPKQLVAKVPINVI